MISMIDFHKMSLYQWEVAIRSITDRLQEVECAFNELFIHFRWTKVLVEIFVIFVISFKIQKIHPYTILWNLSHDYTHHSTCTQIIFFFIRALQWHPFPSNTKGNLHLSVLISFISFRFLFFFFHFRLLFRLLLPLLVASAYSSSSTILTCVACIADLQQRYESFYFLFISSTNPCHLTY